MPNYPIQHSCSAPALYEKYANGNPPAVDEWTLSQNMAADTAGGGLSQLENHYKTFIVSRINFSFATYAEHEISDRT